MPRGGARPGAGRKAMDQPTEPLLTYSLMLRLSDVGVLNHLGRGNLSLGLRRLVDQHRAQTSAAASGHTPGPAPGSRSVTTQSPANATSIRGDEKGTTQYG